MKKNKIIILLVFVMSLFVLPNKVFANYNARAVIYENDKLCDVRLTNYGITHNWPISGKCFYANENLNTVTSGVLFLDTGDEVEVYTDKATIPSNDSEKCSDYYVYTRYQDKYGYFCNANLKSNLLTDEMKAEFEAEGFPESYWEKLAVLKAAHPNWVFKAAKTNIDFNEAVNGEITDISRNLIQVVSNIDGLLSTESGSYNYKTNKYKVFDGSNWYSAGHDTVAYYMDPRNFLIDMYIFQFEALAYDDKFSDEALTNAINKMLVNNYLANFTADFITAGKNTLVSPVYLASLSKQEVTNPGDATMPYRSISGEAFTYGNITGSGVYNFYNIGATGGAGAVERGLVYALNSGWTTPALAIEGGARFIAEAYISIGQSTSYFKKWDVVSNINSASGANYVHQYMQNIQAPMSEAESTFRSYSQNGILNSNFVFYIPVYLNMPEVTALPHPGNPNNYLKSLSINGNVIAEFDGDNTEYNYNLDSSVSKVKIHAERVVGADINLEYNVDKNMTIPITVKAVNGVERVYKVNINLVNNSNNNQSTEINSIQDLLNQAGIKNGETILSGIPVSSNVNYISNKIKNINANAIVEYIKNPNNKGDTVATGDIVKITMSGTTKEYKVVIYGDINGDGKISLVDYAKVKNFALKLVTLDDISLKAADVNRDGEVKLVDYAIIKNTALGKRTIEQ